MFVRASWLKRWQKKDWLICYDNVPAHTALSELQYLMGKHMAVVNHPPYLPDLTLYEFFLFLRMKSQPSGAFSSGRNAEPVI
jgi:hypothetical protein